MPPLIPTTAPFLRKVLRTLCINTDSIREDSAAGSISMDCRVNMLLLIRGPQGMRRRS